jgi:hypothetical protein
MNPIEKAYKHVYDLCDGERWTMRVPVDEERDSDCIIVAGLKYGETRIAELEALTIVQENLPVPSLRKRITELEAENTALNAQIDDLNRQLERALR